MFEDKLKLYRETINDELKKVLDIIKNKDCVKVCDAIEYSLLEGGKLIRPVLTLAVCDMFNCDFKKAVCFASAVEFIHVGSLVHDDLPCMDDDVERRGKPSCHIKYGESTAVLVGDSLFSSAFEILTYSKNYGVTSEEIVEAVSVLSKMLGVNGIIGGQDMDIFTKKEDLTEELMIKVAKYKTASLIKAACSLGAIAAKANSLEKEIVEKYATFFGVAFQICDDILDYGEEKEKKDLNFLSIYSLKKAKEKVKECCYFAVRYLKKIKGSEFLIELTNFVLNRVN